MFFLAYVEMKRMIIFMAVLAAEAQLMTGEQNPMSDSTAPFRTHMLFAVECRNYFDWQTVGLMHSHRKAGQAGGITRLLSCREDEKKKYTGMELAPTFEIPSMSIHPATGYMYSGMNKATGIVHWLKRSKEAEDVDWVVILDSDVIIRSPILPWELGAEKGRALAACNGDSVECDCIGGLLAIHIDDLRDLASLWVSKTDELLKDRPHRGIHYTDNTDLWHGYTLASTEVGIQLKITNHMMIYPGHIPRVGAEPILLHYDQPFDVANWSFSKLEYQEDDMVYDCHRLFPQPPYPGEVKEIEGESDKGKALLLIIECLNTLNEGLQLQHAANGCPKPIRSKGFEEITQQRHLTQVNAQNQESYPKIHTIFSAECSPYFDWQTVALVHSFYRNGQPGSITRLLTCAEEDLKQYKGHDLAPTHYVPSMSRHPLTGDWYPEINKPAAVVHWINHVKIEAEYVVILDADMLILGPIIPSEFNAGPGRPVSTPYQNLIGCDNELAKIHTRNPDACNKVGGVIIMHSRDVRRFALAWLHKTQQLRADISHWSASITGDNYEAGEMSSLYGYSFAAAELNFRHVISNKILFKIGSVPLPGIKYRVVHYGLGLNIGNYSFDKANWTDTYLVERCWAKFPDPPNASALDSLKNGLFQRDLLTIQCINSLNEALYRHHERKKCPDPSTISTPTRNKTGPDRPALPSPTQGKQSKIMESRKLGKADTVEESQQEVQHEPDQELPPPGEANQTSPSMRVGVMSLWAFSIFLSLAVMWMIISSRSRQRKRSKNLKTSREHFR